MIRGVGGDIVSIEIQKKSNSDGVRVRFKINIDDELDISDILTEIMIISEVDKVELIEH